MNTMIDHPSTFIEKEWQLSLNDRCDSCSAAALVRVIGKTGSLDFCGHHYNKIMDNAVGYDKMMKFMVEIIDEREKISKD